MKIAYPPELPVSAARRELMELIRAHPVVIVCGDTGSGKTTQLPKMLVELGYGETARIGCTQPRRLAAVSMARRLADEMGVPLGQEVGYQVRFDNTASEATRIKFMTDGILLAELQHDRLWRQYDALIIDEVHERNLNIDFILGCLKRLLPRRPELKIVISSATLDAERFSSFFGEAPVARVEGRRFPVEDFHLPPESDDEDTSRRIARALDWISSLDDQGDVLVFLPGEREIHDAADLLRGMKYPATDILPLYARLSLNEQQRVFQTGHNRRVILATNVAETSITIPNIHYVIDTGDVRIKRYNPRLRVERLQVEMVSQASASQRRGRCGRVADGICVRLYSREALEAAEPFTPPEIQRDSLADVILTMKMMGLPPIEDFPFVEPPRAPLIREGYKTLTEIGALDDNRNLTPTGRQIGRFPVDPQIARMIVQSHREHCLDDMLAVAAALSIQDPRERPADCREKADAAQARWKDPRSDFMTLLNLWQSWQEARRLSRSKQRAFCRGHFLSARRMEEWSNTREEIAEIASELGWKPAPWKGSAEKRYAALHKSILAGIPLQIGLKEERHLYRGPHDLSFQIFPGSSLFGNPPDWLMAFELVETTRLYARLAARIEPAWLEQSAPHLCKAVYGQPYWNEAAGFVYAEKTLLCGGLPLLERQPVHYGPVAPREAREIFLTQGLIPGRLSVRASWLKHYLQLLDQLRALETRIRRPDILLDIPSLRDRFDRVLPEAIHNAPDFGRWIHAHPDALPLTLDDLLLPGHSAQRPDLYPDTLSIEGIECPLRYTFNPGEPGDGLLLICPLQWAPLLTEALLSWTIPGWLEEKIHALLRTLTPRIRQRIMPLRATAQRLAESCLKSLSPWPPVPESLPEFLAASLRNQLQEIVGAGDFNPAALPAWLQITVEIQSPQGQTLYRGISLDNFSSPAPVATRATPSGPLPPPRLSSAPAISLPLFFRREHADHIRFIEKRVAFPPALRHLLAAHPQPSDPFTDLLNAVLTELFLQCARQQKIERSLIPGQPDPAIAARLAPLVRAALCPRIEEHIELLSRIVAAHEAARLDIIALDKTHAAATLHDLAMQDRELFFPGFLRLPGHFSDLARWVRARKIRVERARHSPEKDAAKLAPLLPLRDRLHALLLPAHKTAVFLDLDTISTPLSLLQECRVLAFAPEAGTRVKAPQRQLQECLDLIAASPVTTRPQVE